MTSSEEEEATETTEAPGLERWHIVRVWKGGDAREDSCHETRDQAWSQVAVTTVDMEEDGWEAELEEPGMGLIKMRFPPPWGRGREEGFDERPHVFWVRPCRGHEVVVAGRRMVGQYTRFRCSLALVGDAEGVETHAGVIRAVATVRYSCQHHAEVEILAWDEAEARTTYVQLMRGRCPDCRRASPTGL